MRNRIKPSRSRRSDNSSAGYTPEAVTKRQHKLHQDLAEFEDYQTILKTIRKDIKAGMTQKELAAKYAPLAQARVISEMLTSENPTAALAAAKDLLDRVEGKATEKKEVTHRFKDMSEKELDAILKSEEEDLQNMEERFDQ